MATASKSSASGLVIFTLCLLGFVKGNNPPQVSFGPTSGYVYQFEDAAIGTLLFTISARDSDSTSLTFNTSTEETRKLVNLEPKTSVPPLWTVDVKLAARLDRDNEPSTRTLQFQVQDGSITVSGRVTLAIRDVNDYPPYFMNLPYRLEIEEGAKHVNQSVFWVTATDPDDGASGMPLYFMTAKGQGADQVYNTTFAIKNPDFGNITLERELDYEKQTYYEYTVTSTDKGQPPCPGPNCKCNNITEPNLVCEGIPAIFTVSVRDVQDTPPSFMKLPYYVSVYENVTLGASIFGVSAIDGDRGVPNMISYTLFTEGEYNFTINEADGSIYVNSALDADDPNGRNFNLQVMASEKNTSGVVQMGETTANATVSVTVLDVNDNPPLFNRSSYTLTVQENTPSGVPLVLNDTDFIEVTDKDQSVNSQFSLRIEKDGETYTVFETLPKVGTTIQGTTTVTIRVHNSSVLDYEKVKSITFELIAQELRTAEKFYNSTTVTVFLEDVNDNSPVFQNSTPDSVNITEHSAYGTEVATFSATDADSGDFGKVAYSLEDDIEGRFRIDPDTGNLTINKDIDRDAGEKSFTLVVLATDNMAGDENNRRFARHRVVINVLDINDNAPVFDTHVPSVTVPESTKLNTTLMTLTARDKDVGENATVTYSILSIEPMSDMQFFGITSNTDVSTAGTLFVNSSLEDFSGQYNVTIMATDGGVDPLNSTTLVVVYVDDVNLHSPVFVTPNQSDYNASSPDTIAFVKINETQLPGLSLMMISATDRDKGDNGQVSYSFEPDPDRVWTLFNIDRSSGNLTTDKELDYENPSQKNLTITLKASDNGRPSLFTVIPFRVELMDIDDNDPLFHSSTRVKTLEVEEGKINAYVGSVDFADDKDFLPENRIMCYYLYGKDNTQAFILTTNGSLFTAIKLDREVQDTVQIVIKVSKNCFLPLDYYTKDSNNTFDDSDYSLMRLIVKVLDINDNPPVFIEKHFTVGLLYDAENGTAIFNLAGHVNDSDIGNNTNNMFRLLTISTEGSIPSEVLNPYPFAVLESGSVITMKLFSSDTVGVFIIDVLAYDRDKMNDTAQLRVYLISNYQRVKVVAGFKPNEMELNRESFIQKLSDALSMNVVVDKIATHTDSSGQQDPSRSDVYIHARYKSSGDIVPAYELWRQVHGNWIIRDQTLQAMYSLPLMVSGQIVPDLRVQQLYILLAFDYYPQVQKVFTEFRVIETLPVQEENKASEEKENLQRPFIIVAVALGCVVIVLILVLINTIRRYRRRLKAATTPAYMTSKQEPEIFVAPGTNKYYAAENPLYGQNFKTIDPDRLSNGNDSLDDNQVDGSSIADDEKEPEEEQEMYLDLNDDGRSPAHVNHLAMVIQQYEEQNNAKNSRDAPPTSPDNHDKGDYSGSKGRHSNGHVPPDRHIDQEAFDAYLHTDI